jgi:hypothetical protein
MSGLSLPAKAQEMQAISRGALADSWARQRATRGAPESGPTKVPNADPLGQPLSIREVAGMLAVSPWTVRQRHIPDGLPHFRSGPNGKLIFFRDQVVAWILAQQAKERR